MQSFISAGLNRKFYEHKNVCEKIYVEKHIIKKENHII